MALSPTSSHGGTSSSSSAVLYDFTVTGSDKASIDTFVDAPTVASFAGYTLLDICLYVRTDEAVVNSGIDMRVNNDSTAKYDRVFTQTANATVAGNNARGQTSWLVGAAGASAGASVFSQWNLRLYNYAGTVGFKTADAFGGIPDGTLAANILEAIYSLAYESTSAITRFAVSVNTAAKNLKVGTRLTIYGR